MQREQRIEISQAGLQLAIQEIKDDMFDTPACDFTVAKLLGHCGQTDQAEQILDEMLLKWGASPDVQALRQNGYAAIRSGDPTIANAEEALGKPQHDESPALEVI
ncbi:hypothetical protein HXW73_04000 [Halomonas sp. SH5A2]|uniref:hypothetical protein n=1 Tax=Halomonas sp. SH5A2 TaxID=2749040 RepID=UPI001640A581|nr:hypothetical protein [Halomonas sp. SH5A2]QNI02162.1 hypothetical protein HXW73_04000 [Halomonas sp. SH5A2]